MSLQTTSDVPGSRRAPLAEIRLIDRRSGQPLRLNGRALTALSRDPHRAASELMAGRNPDIWSARIEYLSQGKA